MKITVIRSKRKTLCLQIRDGEVCLRAPFSARESELRAFAEAHADWIKKQLAKDAERQAAAEASGKLTEEELRALTELAKIHIAERVRYYAPLVGTDYGKITVRRQKTRWGSCSSRGNLSFNCLLPLTPPEVIDSVVVHELCHRKEMNHSDRFYREIYRVFPDYDKWHRWLTENGAALLRRLP